MPTTPSTISAYSGNRQPIFFARSGILGSAKLTNQVVSTEANTGTPVEIYNSTNRGNVGGAIESITVMPLGVNIATALRLYYRFASWDSGQWFIFQDEQLPAIASVPEDNKVSNSYPVEIPLVRAVSPVSHEPSTAPTKLIRLNPEDVVIGCGLSKEIAAGVIVTVWGGEYK